MNWSEIIGNENKIAQIRKMISNEKFPNAIIFSGIKGIGKRKIAETAAMTLLCENKNAPCGKCNSCRTFLTNTNPNYYLIEPDRSKANPIIKIEQIRELQEKIFLMPFHSKYQVIVIDDAEYMNVASQNCLLKTLEEPTGLAKIILITSNIKRLIMTILSRCSVINFERLTEFEIKSGIENFDSDNADTISIIADGSFGNAINILKNDGIKTREDVIKFLNSLQILNVEEIFIKGLELSKLPKDKFKEWMIFFVKILRDVLISETDLDKKFYYNSDIQKNLFNLRRNFSDEQIFKMINLTAETQRRLNSNMILELLIESYFLRLKQICKGE